MGPVMGGHVRSSVPRRALLCALLPLACTATAGPRPVERATRVIRIVCEDEKPVGSAIPVRRCRGEEQAELDRDALQRELLRPRGNTPLQ